MMDNKHYACAFSQLILSGRCACQFSAKDCVAEKEFGVCCNQSASHSCQSLYQHLKDNSHFALKSHHQSNLSVGQQAKIKMGGLLALQDIVETKQSSNIGNVAALVAHTKAQYLDFQHLPFSQLMPSIAQYQFRQKSDCNNPS